MKEKTFHLIDKGQNKEEETTKFFVVNWFDMIFYDKDCLMIQFVDISKTLMYDLAVQQKNFASMLNATVSHELRGPISSITQNIHAQADEI